MLKPCPIAAFADTIMLYLFASFSEIGSTFLDSGWLLRDFVFIGLRMGRKSQIVRALQ